jgi:uncharacterized membrane protein YbhN (UPF0104 family)
MKKWIKFTIILLGVFSFIGALILFYNQLKNLNYIDVINALKTIPKAKIIIALFLSLLYYTVSGGYDIIAFKYINSKILLKPKNILFTCFISNILGNNTGYSMFFGGSIRYRLYSMHNISITNITKIILFSSATIWLGLLTIGGFIFIFWPFSLKDIINFNFSTRIFGIFFIIIVALYIFMSILHLGSIKLFKFTINFPNIKIVIYQIILATCDWLIASFILFVLMPSREISYFILLKVFLVSQFVGIISQVPGGIGFFETSIALMLPSFASNPRVIGGLLAYRVVFYFFPLLIALIFFVSFEFMAIMRKFNNVVRFF